MTAFTFYLERSRKRYQDMKNYQMLFLRPDKKNATKYFAKIWSNIPFY